MSRTDTQTIVVAGMAWLCDVYRRRKLAGGLGRDWGRDGTGTG